MNQYVRWGLIAAAVIGAGAVIYFEINKYNTGVAMGGKQAATNPGTPQPNPTPAPACGFPLKKGSKNECVRSLQQALLDAYGPTILPKYGADGDWGTETDGAVQAATGRVQINNQTDLDTIIAQLESISIMMGF